MIIATGMALSFFNLGAWGALYAVTPETYPTSLRATGSGWAAGVGRIASIVAPLMVPVLLAAGGAPLLFVVFAASSRSPRSRLGTGRPQRTSSRRPLSGHRLGRMASVRFVAIGDSFTEGVGDELPDGSVRGWADLVAEGWADSSDNPSSMRTTRSAAS